MILSNNCIMSSQNKSILSHPKMARLWSIMSKKSIDMGCIIEKEMDIRSKHKQAFLLFPKLITLLCQCAGVPRYVAAYIEVTLSSSKISGILRPYTL